MSLYKREGTPFYWFDFTVAGVRHRGSTGCEKLSDAKDVERDERAKAKKQPRYGDKWKIRNVLGAYWNDHAVNLKSAKTIEYQILELSAGLGADMLVERITPATLLAYRARRRGHDLSESSINREMHLLRAAITHAAQVHCQHVPNIPWAKMTVKEPAGRTRFLSQDEFASLLEHCHASLKPIIWCAVTTGLRKQNILTMDWQQVRLNAKLITVMVKGNKPHAVRIVPQLMVWLSTVKEAERKGRVFDRTNFEKRWDAALKDAGLADFRFHDLRHTFASWARQAGAGIEDICEALAHSDISMSMRYAHIKPDSENTAFDKVSEALASQSASQIAQNKRKTA